MGLVCVQLSHRAPIVTGWKDGGEDFRPSRKMVAAALMTNAAYYVR